MKKLALTLLVTATLAGTGCREKNEEPLTYGEAFQALEEASISTQAAELTSGSIELTTDFTIGGAVEAAAEEIQAYVASQLPCAEITLQGNTLAVEYGAKPGNCTYKGQTYSGSHSITVEKNETGEVVVTHVWDELENGVMSVSGDAVVTWNFQDETRHVVHELTWTRLKDGRTGVGSGDRLQSTLDGGLAEGIRIDGDRRWEGEAGTWDLAIDGVEVRWADPVPQAGSYTLTTPEDKEVVLSFQRKDEDTITVTLTGTKKTFTFDVTSAGGVTSTGEA